MSSGTPARPKAVCDAMKAFTWGMSRSAPFAEIRFDSAGRDDIHGYFALAKFLREIAREHLDCTL